MTDVLSRAAGALAGVAEPLLSLLDPPRCAACDASLGERAVFCAPCLASVLPLAELPPPPGVARLVAFAEYGGALAQALQRLKYARRPELARPLGALLARAAAGHGGELVVPVPLHPARLAERGFNQAALLARAVAGPAAPRALARVELGVPQARLDRPARLAALTGAFVARRRLDGRRVLLVDDVSTTGATLAACAAALREAGAARVEAAVVAKAS